MKKMLEAILWFITGAFIFGSVFTAGLMVGRWGGQGEGYEECRKYLVLPTGAEIEHLRAINEYGGTE